MNSIRFRLMCWWYDVCPLHLEVRNRSKAHDHINGCRGCFCRKLTAQIAKEQKRAQKVAAFIQTHVTGKKQERQERPQYQAAWWFLTGRCTSDGGRIIPNVGSFEN